MLAKLNIKNYSLSEIGLWLLIPFASLTSHTWLPLPPTMLLFLGAVACWFFIRFNGEWRMENGELNAAASHSVKPHSQFSIVNCQFSVISVFFIFVLYIFTSQYFLSAPFRHYMGAIFAPLYLIFILIFSENTSTDFLKDLGRKFIRYSLVILCVEAVLRYAINFYYIGLDATHFYGFYSFKFNGPMYLTSNATACHLVTLLFFILWWGYTYKESIKKEIWIALILIVLTFSRASFPAVVFGLFYYHFFKDLNWKKSLLVLFSLVITGFFALL
jgi:hypothetical protein